MDGNTELRRDDTAPIEALAGQPPAPREPATPGPMATRPHRRRPVGLILFLVFLSVLFLHTLLDRLAPYTSEATLQAPVVGVAPNVSGTIVGVSIRDNQLVCYG